MNSQVLSKQQKNEENPASIQLKISVEQAQEVIYRFMLNLVKQATPEQVLAEFSNLFFSYQATQINNDASKALFEIIFSNNQVEFINTLKRCCYILINNWETERNRTYIVTLVNIFAKLDLEKPTFSLLTRRLKTWLKLFCDSKDYTNLKLFITKIEAPAEKHWSERYASYLLISQYADPNNSQEQRQASRTLAKEIKEKFKFDLAMYTAHSHHKNHLDKRYHNPTGLGDEVLNLIKNLLTKRRTFSYHNLAHIFLKQTQDICYADFKKALKNYLASDLNDDHFLGFFLNKLEKKLDIMYADHDYYIIDKGLLYRTCQRLIDYLILGNHQEISELFVLFISLQNPLTLVIILLKLILICPRIHVYLESKIAGLIQYYLNYGDQECQEAINFFEVFNVALTIYAEKNTHYDVIAMNHHYSSNSETNDLDSYRIFCQYQPRKQPQKTLPQFGTLIAIEG